MEKNIQKLEIFCAYRERSTAEVVKKCKDLSIPPEDVEAIITHLKDNNFLNDKRFIENFIRGKTNIKKWGKQKILAQLQPHRLDKKIISSLLNDIDENLYTNRLFEVLHKKAATIPSKNDADKKQKLIRYALQKGYELDLILKTLEKLQ